MVCKDLLGDYKMQTELGQIISIVLSGVFVLLFGLLVRGIVATKKEIPHVFSLLPADVQKIIQDAAKFAAEFVEQMDKHGEIDALVDDLKTKGQVKLNLAVDYAIQYLEKLFLDNGFTIDIDQEQIKKFIQKYVWENPDLFPSHKNVEEAPHDTGTGS
jgi:hypothetical protein